MSSYTKTAVLCLILLAIAGCGESRPKAPAEGAYGQIAARPSTNIALARPARGTIVDNRSVLTCVQTELSPATLFSTASNHITFFADLEKHGRGAPSHIAFSGRSGPRAFKNGERIESPHLEENWIMVWFAGARGWTNDSPWVVYLQHRPSAMHLDSNGLHFRFSGPAGDIVLLPLYGNFAAPAEGQRSEEKFGGKPIKTWEWAKVLPREPLMRVRYWASALREFPVYCEETFSVDRSYDSVTIRQKTSWYSIRDDWGTKALKLNPISPSLAVRSKDRTFPVKFNRPVMDLEMPTPHGSYMAAEGDAAIEATLFVLQHVNTKGTNETLTPVLLTNSRGTWAQWTSEAEQRDAFINMAREAYRAGDIDRYNYACYLFARAFTLRPLKTDTASVTGERLIPSGPLSPFVIGIQREVSGPNPPLVQTIKPDGESWPRIVTGDQWIFGSVKVSAEQPPSRSEHVPINWNTEALVFR